LAANTEETFPGVGKMGLPIFVGLRAAEIPDLQTNLALYRQAWREAGHPGLPSVYLRIPVYVSTTERGAIEEPRESLTHFFGRQSELARAIIGRAGAGPADRRRALADRMANLSYEDMLAKKVAFGTAAGVIDRLTQLRHELGLDGIVAELNPGGLIPIDRLRSSRRTTFNSSMVPPRLSPLAGSLRWSGRKRQRLSGRPLTPPSSSRASPGSDAARPRAPTVTRRPWPRVTSVRTALLDGDAPRSDRCGRQRRRAEDQPETPRGGRDREGHGRQGQVSVAHVHCGGAAQGGAPVSRDGPTADLPFHGDVLRRPEERGAQEHRLELACRRAVPRDPDPLAKSQTAQRDAVEGRAAGEDRLAGARHPRGVLRGNCSWRQDAHEPKNCRQYHS